MQIKGVMSGLVSGNSYSFRINKTGLLGTNCSEATIDKEHNPLFAVDKWGNPFTYQDPEYGRIPSITSNSETLFPFFQNEVQVNLTGKDGIIGRSLVIENEGGGIIGCC